MKPSDVDILHNLISADLDEQAHLAADAASADATDVEAHLTEQEFIRDCLDVVRGRGLEAEFIRDLVYRVRSTGDWDDPPDMLRDLLGEVMIDLGL